MKIIKAGLTILEAIAEANRLAVETNRVHSVRRAKGMKFEVYEGMIGTISGLAVYTARPENLRWKGEHGILV